MGWVSPDQRITQRHQSRKGFWATANQNVVAADYKHTDAIGKVWADSFRGDRINEVLSSGKKFSPQEMMALQFDYYSIPARTLIPLLTNLKSADAKTEAARQKLLNWNFILDPHSVEATIYAAWEKKMSSALYLKAVPAEARNWISYIPLSKIIQWITKVDFVFDHSPKSRDQFLISTLEETVSVLEKKLGEDQSKWEYGQSHFALIKHTLSNAASDSLRKKIDAGPWPRGGYGATVGMTTNSDNQQFGASFRMVADVSDWEKTMFTNTPGQSGDPSSHFYKNLFKAWATDQHFPVYFSREKVLQNAREKMELIPRN